MKILDKYIELIKKGYCSDCNELNCIDNFPQEKIVQEIKQLQQENQQLKKQKDDVVELIKKTPFLYSPFKEEVLRMLGEIK